VAAFCDQLSRWNYFIISALWGRPNEWTLNMQRLSQPWTPEEDERIRSLSASGASAMRASAALKRNKVSVAARAHKIGCPFQTISAARKKWADTPDNPWRG
jgi:hypothetical protein